MKDYVVLVIGGNVITMSPEEAKEFSREDANEWFN